METTNTLSLTMAENFASMLSSHLTREYPNKLTHALSGTHDVQAPSELHPSFYGSYDWHSSVHGHWLAAYLVRNFPELSLASRMTDILDQHLTENKVARECAYFRQPWNRSFERPYGWAWVLALDAEIGFSAGPHAKAWSAALEPLTDLVVTYFEEFLAKATYPIRVGTHFNTAFSLYLALEYAEHTGRHNFQESLVNTARRWHLNDLHCQAWEPCGDEFLSPSLVEALLMSKALVPDEFQHWLTGFLPDLQDRAPATLFVPATVSDRSDGKIAHLDGLNLSRAWCMRKIANALPKDDVRVTLLRGNADVHVQSALDHVAGDYMGEHWLATFATLALTA
jgi:hypothetical protein